MKISNMTAKTALEVQDTDVLVIEDGIDTKQITVAELREYLLSSGISKAMKIMINETLDNVAAALNAAKYVMSQTQYYKVSVVIPDDSGVIQISFKNAETDTWLTKDDLDVLFVTGGPSKIEIMVSNILTVPTNVEIIASEETVDMGIIKLQFTGLESNDIADITYDDVYITIPETEEYQYVLTIEPDLFSNAVPYVSEVVYVEDRR